MDMIEKVARAIRTKMGGCYSGRSMTECTDMIPGGNCQCADLARAAIEAMQIDQLMAALEPFADVDGEGAADFPDDAEVTVKFGRTTYFALKLGDFRRARAAIEAMQIDRTMMDWQPIETAPKDGSPVLLTQGRDVAEGFWNRSPNSPRMPPYWATHRMVGNPGEQPTHWQPLPDPPK